MLTLNSSISFVVNCRESHLSTFDRKNDFITLISSILQIFLHIVPIFDHEKTKTSTSPQESAIFFYQTREGGRAQRIFETFQKIHLFWKVKASLYNWCTQWDQYWRSCSSQKEGSGRFHFLINSDVSRMDPKNKQNLDGFHLQIHSEVSRVDPKNKSGRISLTNPLRCQEGGS